MDDDQKKASVGSWLPILTLLTPLLYFLSIGPAILIHEHAPKQLQEAIELFYYPVIMLAETFPLFRKLLQAYGSLWEF